MRQVNQDPYHEIASVPTVYLYDGEDLLEEVDSAGNLLLRYNHGPDFDQTLSMFTGSAVSYYQSDVLNTITSLSNSTGALASTYVYDSFGRLISSTGTVNNPLQYTGRELDPESGLYYDRARYYDPTSGRFLSEDPARYLGDVNFYRYVQNDPIGFVDPLGLWPSATGIGAGIGGVLGGVAGVVIGAGGGTLVAPGVGTIGGGVEGVVVGVAGGAAAGALIGGVIGNVLDNVWDGLSFSRGNSDPIPKPNSFNPGREPCNKGKGPCKPCPPDTPKWRQPGNKHGGTLGWHTHWYHWNQNPETCECFSARMDGGSD